jgi:hypothetical protein
MRLAASLLLVLACGSAPASAEVAVRVDAGHVDLTATAAPLADVLDRLSRQTGMKIVYEGPAPRQLVTLTIRGRTPAETVLAVFEGLGINYAMLGDATGAGVQTLVVAGAATATAASSAAAGRPTPATRRSFGPPPGSSPEPEEPAFDEAEEEADPSELDLAGAPPGPEVPEAAPPQQPGGPPANVPAPNPGAPPLGAVPAPPQGTPFSASPFTPQPQPFPPVPPGAPVQGAPQPGEENQPEQNRPQTPPQ